MPIKPIDAAEVIAPTFSAVEEASSPAIEKALEIAVPALTAVVKPDAICAAD